MNYINVYKDIYVDLDAILDTRLGTLYFLDKNLYDFYIKTDSDFYKNRLIDEFSYIPSSVFNWFYRRRSNRVLKHSIMTPLLPLLNLSITDMITKRTLSDKTMKKINIDVNVYPYKLDYETLNLIKASIYGKLSNPEFVNVNFINTDYEDLTSSKCEKYGIMCMYDGMEWLHIRGLLKDIEPNLPNTALILPYKLQHPIVFKKPEDIEKYFNDLEKMFSYFIRLEFNRIEMFSFM